MQAFQIVPMHVARNPVARAIAATKLRQAVLDFQLRLHFLPAGQVVMEDVHCAIQVLSVCLLGMEELGRLDEPAARVMRGAQQTLLQCAEAQGRWRTEYAAPIDISLQRAVEIFKTLPAEVSARAWQRVRAIEIDAGLVSGANR